MKGLFILREEVLFNFDWRFHLGDVDESLPPVKGPIYSSAKTERMKWGPACRYYNDALDDFRQDVEYNNREKWEAVDLPHDYIINGEYSKDNNNALGYFKYDNGWYRKHFSLDESDKDRRITLVFDGVASIATVYLNGCLIKHNFCGYTTFECDITDYVEFGADRDNVLAVYVKYDGHEGWWYEGAGIYRNVHLVKTEPVCIDLYGVYCAPRKLSDDEWQVDFETTVVNTSYNPTTVLAVTKMIDKDGNVFCESKGEVAVSPCDKKAAKYSVNVRSPHLWDIDDPYIYDIVTELIVDGKVIDENKTYTGFRTVEYDAQKGFFLNGRHTLINGVCSHIDFGLTGKAVPDNIHRYKVRLIKQMGANAYRTSHYPHTEAIMEELDRQGIMCMDETRRFESCEESIEQLEMLIKRDRNRPCVIMWSVGNEEPYQTNDNGRRINRRLIEAIRKLDNTRAISAAVSNDPENATVFGDSDLIGVNYGHWSIDNIHKKYPNKPIFSSECCATGTTRGWYFDDDETRGYLPAYDRDTNSWFTGREFFRKFVLERPWFFGSFQWIAFEHRGETVWPRICSQAGAIDLFLQKKDAFYQNKSHWTTEPMIHLLPHWNFSGLENEPIKVFAYTNCQSAELFLNGQSLGKQEIEQAGHGEWTVNYMPGELKVVGYNEDRPTVSDTAVTTGKPVALKLVCENADDISANGIDIALFSCYCVDENGVFVPNAAPFVEFNCSSLGKIVGTGSDVADHEPVNLPKRQMRAGLISIAVRVSKTDGKLQLFASSNGLDSAVCSIDLK